MGILGGKAAKKNIGIFFGIFILAVGVYFAVRATRSGGVSTEFLEARKEAAGVSARIVDLTNYTSDKIRAVNYSEFAGDAERALTFIREANASNQEAYAQVFELTKHLQRLAESLSSMGASELRGKAYDAISTELSLVSEFILYTQKLNTFLEKLGKTIATGSAADRAVADMALQAANEQAARINTINQEFNAKIQAFDQAL